MYTKGIRKIFDSSHLGKSLEKVKEVIELTGYNAFTFNGQVYIKVKDVTHDKPTTWVKSCFEISDFMDTTE